MGEQDEPAGGLHGFALDKEFLRSPKGVLMEAELVTVWALQVPPPQTPSSVPPLLPGLSPSTSCSSPLFSLRDRLVSPLLRSLLSFASDPPPPAPPSASPAIC